jgi:hypothetical protein
MQQAEGNHPPSAYLRYEAMNTSTKMSSDVYAHKAEAMGSLVFEDEATQQTERHNEMRGKFEELP